MKNTSVASLGVRRSNPVARLKLLGEPVIAASKLVVDLAKMLNAPIPDDAVECARWLARIPPDAEMQNMLAMLEETLTEQASSDQAQALAVVLLDGFGRAPGEGAASYAAALVAATEEDMADDDAEPAQISVTIIALAIVRIWRQQKFAPVPCEFRAACLAVRDRVEGLKLRRGHAVPDVIDLRDKLEWPIMRQTEPVDWEAWANAE
jgi:hypothetical protein